MRHHVLISGTGRAGTTLLVRILTVAGVDTGFDPTDFTVDPLAQAGLERDLRGDPDCYIVKSPWIATYIDEVLSGGEVAIDHAIVCMRDLHEAAESRRRVQLANNTSASVPGGLWNTSNPEEQEDVLARLFFQLIFHLSKHDVPTTFLHFPRFATDPAYFIEKLLPVFPGIDPALLESARRSEARPELISDFGNRAA